MLYKENILWIFRWHFVNIAIIRNNSEEVYGQAVEDGIIWNCSHTWRGGYFQSQIIPQCPFDRIHFAKKEDNFVKINTTPVSSLVNMKMMFCQYRFLWDQCTFLQRINSTQEQRIKEDCNKALLSKTNCTTIFYHTRIVWTDVKQQNVNCWQYCVNRQSFLDA